MEVMQLNEARVALQESEASLMAQRAELRQMIDVVPHYLFVKDDEGRYLVANEAFAAAHGTTPEQIVGKRDVDLGVDLAEAGRYYQQELEVVQTGVPRFSEGEPRQIDGEQRIFETLKVPFHRAGSDRPAVLGLVRDITDEQHQARQLRRAERLASVGTLVGGVAHELNNPLTSIKGFSSLMLMDERSEEDREGLETILREADRMARIVADLRRLARETQDVETPLAPVDVNEVVEHVLKLRGYSLATHNIEVVRDLQPDLGPVMGDRSRLEQVVLNLVVNAEQAMAGTAGRGTLGLRTKSGPRAVSLCVEDTGPGIPREHQERIFDAFWSTKAPGEGTGLGLSLVHGIIQDLGGEIHVSSEPGKGACFTVVLPRAGETAPASAPTQAVASDPAPARLLRVLVVDDEPSIRSTLTRYLRRRGHQVDEAAEGGAALQQLARAREQGTPYDVIVSDLRMPGLDGGELLQRLRDDAEGMENRLVFLTGDAASPEAERLLQSAGVPVVLKPFDFGRMEALIERVAAGGAHQEALHASGDQIHIQSDPIRRSYLARLRSDPGIPATSHLGDADVEDHTCVLIANLAQALIIPAASVMMDHALEDSTRILRITSDLHGVQRSRLGWNEAHLAREYTILEEEILRGLVQSHPASGSTLHAEAVRTVHALLSSACETSIAALRRERTPNGSDAEAG
jgi:two-component system NtrC family sensor kinase